MSDNLNCLLHCPANLVPMPDLGLLDIPAGPPKRDDILYCPSTGRALMTSKVLPNGVVLADEIAPGYRPEQTGDEYIIMGCATEDPTPRWRLWWWRLELRVRDVWRWFCRAVFK